MRCDVCARKASAPGEPRRPVKVLRFSLIFALHSAGRHTTRGAGAIQLCESCWIRYAAPRRHGAAKVKRPFAFLPSASLEAIAS